MRSNNLLAGIPIVLNEMRGSQRLHWQRRALQIGTLVIAVAIPLLGMFRIDPVAGAFVVLDRQIWWSDFSIVFGFWLVVASSLVLLYSTVGTAFCGWSCPQNTFSEWANWLTKKFLGKRAAIQLDGQKMSVGAQKDHWINWLLLGSILFAMSMFLAFVPVLYFYTPEVIWSFVTFAEDDRLAGSIHFIYFIFVIIILLDVAFVRHFWCRFMCVYKVWQHGFKTKNTLRIFYDESRAESCEKCNYCATSCFIDIDPRKTDIYDTCINCGECVTACNTLQAKNGEAGLLSFRIGDRLIKAEKKVQLKVRSWLGKLSTRASWTLPISIFGITMFSWGLINYDPYHLSVYRADKLHGSEIRDYRVALSNKLYKKGNLTIEVQGLDSTQYTLSRPKALFSTVGRIDLNMHIDADLAPGIHAIIVRVKSDDGWQDSYRVQHFVAKNNSSKG